MEDLTRSWNKFSLSEKEEKGVDLSTNKQSRYVGLVAKFFTRTVNIDAVAKTFRPLWRTSKDFRIRAAGKNHLVFEFEDWADAEKVLLGEPWSFDRSLIVFQRIDGGTPIHNLDFSYISIWVQLHNIPLSHMTAEVAISFGKSLGRVIVTPDGSELQGGIS